MTSGLKTGSIKRKKCQRNDITSPPGYDPLTRGRGYNTGKKEYELEDISSHGLQFINSKS